MTYMYVEERPLRITVLLYKFQDIDIQKKCLSQLRFCALWSGKENRRDFVVELAHGLDLTTLHHVSNLSVYFTLHMNPWIKLFCLFQGPQNFPQSPMDIGNSAAQQRFNFTDQYGGNMRPPLQRQISNPMTSPFPSNSEQQSISGMHSPHAGQYNSPSQYNPQIDQ